MIWQVRFNAEQQRMEMHLVSTTGVGFVAGASDPRPELLQVLAHPIPVAGQARRLVGSLWAWARAAPRVALWWSREGIGDQVRPRIATRLVGRSRIVDDKARHRRREPKRAVSTAG